MMKFLHIFLFCFMASNVYAETLFANVGTVTKASTNSTVIGVDNVDYKIDASTVIQQGFVSEGELGPEIPAGQLVGFNVDSTMSPPRLTEIWVLGAE